MKINFPLPADNRFHQYCPECHSEDLQRVFEGKKTFWLCDNCHKKSPRLVVIDPKITWWIDEATKELWHESVGVFVFDKRDRALFFDRILFPFGLTIPAGHLDVGEDIGKAVKRELHEETGIKANTLTLFSEEDIIGDKCRGGADNHKWHLYTTRIEKITEVKTNVEGVKPVWLTLDEALQNEPLFVVRYFIEKYGNKLLT